MQEALRTICQELSSIHMIFDIAYTIAIATCLQTFFCAISFKLAEIFASLAAMEHTLLKYKEHCQEATADEINFKYSARCASGSQSQERALHSQSTAWEREDWWLLLAQRWWSGKSRSPWIPQGQSFLYQISSYNRLHFSLKRLHCMNHRLCNTLDSSRYKMCLMHAGRAIFHWCIIGRHCEAPRYPIQRVAGSYPGIWWDCAHQVR